MTPALKSQTLVERLLTWTGYAGFSLGLVITIFSVATLIVRKVGIFIGPTDFLVGAMGVVMGLLLVSLAQALASFRAIAHYTEHKRGSE